MKEKTIRFFALIMAFLLFVLCPLSVYASEKWEGSLGLTLYYNLDEIKQYVKDTAGFWIYYGHQVGAALTADFEKFVNNSNKFDELLSDNKVGLYKDDSGNVKGVYTSKEFMTELKALIEQYAKENESYIIVPVASYRDLDPSYFTERGLYLTVCNLARNYNLIGFNQRFICNLSPVLEESMAFVRSSYNKPFTDYDWQSEGVTAYLYAQDWTKKKLRPYSFDFSSGEASSTGYTSFDQGLITTDDPSNRGVYHESFMPNYVLCHGGKPYDNTYAGNTYYCCLISKDGGRIRVYSSLDDFKRYTCGARKVYYTSNYYNYVPEDLSVSIDDMQKEIDDLSKVIDELLKQIKDDTSESEIEELLKQILDELKNNQGGGGGGSGGGDTTVNVDMTQTNTLLSKILAKVTQIFDKMSETVEGVTDTVHTKIQETLDEMLVQIKKLKHWTMADTAVNAAGAVADWLDFLKGIFDDMENGAGTAVAAVSSSLEGASGLLKTKFPFCIPWDVAFLVTFLAHEPETPVFKLPLHIESVGIDEYIEVDMSEFSGISTISRTILMLIYCYGLLNLTMKIIPVAKEGT